jgi:hypothetical protein
MVWECIPCEELVFVDNGERTILKDACGVKSSKLHECSHEEGCSLLVKVSHIYCIRNLYQYLFPVYTNRSGVFVHHIDRLGGM